MMARSDGEAYYLDWMRQLIAAGDPPASVIFGAKSGTTSGAGNQGTANKAHLTGHAGTAGDQNGSPRLPQGGRQQS